MTFLRLVLIVLVAISTVSAQGPTDDLAETLKQAQDELKAATDAVGRTVEYQRYLRIKKIVDYLTALQASQVTK